MKKITLTFGGKILCTECVYDIDTKKYLVTHGDTIIAMLHEEAVFKIEHLGY